MILQPIATRSHLTASLKVWGFEEDNLVATNSSLKSDNLTFVNSAIMR